MAFIRQITGGILANIPLKLRLQPKQATSPTDGQQITIYVVGLEYAGDISELQEIGHTIALERAKTHVSIAHIEDEARRLLSFMPASNAPLPGDDAGEIVEEFYPEQVVTESAPPRPKREDFQPGAETVTEQNADGEDSGTSPKSLASQTPEAGPREHVEVVEDNRYEITDFVGEIKNFDKWDDALTEYARALNEGEDQQGERGLTTVQDNNGFFLEQLNERGLSDISRRLSREYGVRREAAAARESAKAAAKTDDMNDKVLEGLAQDETSAPDGAAEDSSPPATNEKGLASRGAVQGGEDATDLFQGRDPKFWGPRVKRSFKDEAEMRRDLRKRLSECTSWGEADQISAHNVRLINALPTEARRDVAQLFAVRREELRGA
jgi:hypothetical protein